MRNNRDFTSWWGQSFTTRGTHTNFKKDRDQQHQERHSGTLVKCAMGCNKTMWVMALTNNFSSNMDFINSDKLIKSVIDKMFSQNAITHIPCLVYILLIYSTVVLPYHGMQSSTVQSNLGNTVSQVPDHHRKANHSLFFLLVSAYKSLNTCLHYHLSAQQC